MIDPIEGTLEFSPEERAIIFRLMLLIFANRSPMSIIRNIECHDLQILDKEYHLDLSDVDIYGSHTSRVSSKCLGREWCVAVIQYRYAPWCWLRGLKLPPHGFEFEDFTCEHGEQNLRDDFPSLAMILP